MIEWDDAITGLVQANHFLSVLEQNDLAEEVQALIEKVRKRKKEEWGGKMLKKPQIEQIERGSYVRDFLSIVNSSDYLEAIFLHRVTVAMLAKILKEKRTEFCIIVRRKKVRK